MAAGGEERGTNKGEDEWNKQPGQKAMQGGVISFPLGLCEDERRQKPQKFHPDFFAVFPKRFW